MTRLQAILITIVAVELAGGAALVVRQRRQPTPPVAELKYVDPVVARQVRELIAKCRTAADSARLGEAYLAYGYFNEGEACYRQAAALEPDRPERAYEWGFALERIALYEEANREYERAVRLGYPQPEDCWYNIGRNWERLEKADEARQAFTQAGEQPAARYEIARLLVRAGKDQEAVAVLDRLIGEHAKTWQPYLLRHKIEALKDGPAAAYYADHATRARRSLPNPFLDRDWKRLEDAHDNLGLAAEWNICKNLVAAGKTREAEPRIREALRAEWDPVGNDLLAEVELLRGRRAEAIRLLQEVLDKAGPSIHAVHFLIRLGDAYEENQQPELAVPAWLRAAQLGIGKEVKDAYYKLASHAEKRGDKEAARRYFGQAWFAVGYWKFWEAELDEARGALEKAVDYDPALAAAWFYLGETRRLLGDAAPAREAYQRCLKINPYHGRALRGMTLVDYRPG